MNRRIGEPRPEDAKEEQEQMANLEEIYGGRKTEQLLEDLRGYETQIKEAGQAGDVLPYLVENAKRIKAVIERELKKREGKVEK